MFSLILHVLCAWILYRLLRALVIQAWGSSNVTVDAGRTNGQATILAFVAVCWFALHPIAVYGAAYLTQRTILFATLFSLLSIWFYRRAFAQNGTTDIIIATLFYTLAVFSKEHAIMLPFAAVALTALFEGGWRTHWKRVTLYLVLCTPAALWIFFATRHLVASGYEPDIAMLASKMYAIPIMVHPWGKWLVSVVIQTGLFFDYLRFWIVPDVRLLSADIRFDFVQLWFAWWTFPLAILFFLSPIVAMYFLRKKGLIALFCCGFLYAWVLFLTELAAVRFQEPFVLYRSYLWAPGYVMMLVAVCARVPQRWLVGLAIPVLAVCFLLARDRLASLQDDSHLWKDAAAKLASPNILGSDRIYYNRGQAYFREKRYAEAVADFSRTIAQSPQVYQAYFNRSLAYYAKQNYTEALADLDQVLLLNPKDDATQYMRGLIFELSSCGDAALHAYEASSELGNQMAKLTVGQWTTRQEAAKRRKPILHPVECPV